jgi:hypothetical protein
MNRYRYIRDQYHTPLAVIACIGPGMIGVSVCSKNDQFNKRKGRFIAENRAAVGKNIKFTDRKFINYKGEKRNLQSVVDEIVADMTERSLKFAPAPTPFNPNPTRDV